MIFRKAERKKAKLRLGLVGPAGSGKTYSALLVAKGLGGKVAVVDTENGSADLYAHLLDYDVMTLKPPYDVLDYIGAIEAAEKEGYNVIILDSISHAWAGEGGLLDQQGKIADSGKGNSYTAWRTVTPKHNKFIEKMLGCNLHLIATMRAKTEYAMTQGEKGKVEIKKIGMAPIQREGMDYEFTTVFDIDINHNAQCSKDRTSMFDGKIFALNEKTGEQLLRWLDQGIEAPAPEPAKPEAQKQEAPKQEAPKQTDGKAPEYITPGMKKAIEAIIGHHELDRKMVKEYFLVHKLIGLNDDGDPTLNKLHKKAGNKMIENENAFVVAFKKWIGEREAA